MSLALIFGLLATSCLVFEKPLLNPDEAEIDTRLLGIWQITEEDPNNDTFLHFTIQSAAGKRMNVVKVIHPTNEYGAVADVNQQRIFKIKSGHNDYMNVVIMDPNSVDEQGRLTKTGYLVYRYVIDEKNDLKIWSLKYESLKKAIADKKLSGKASESTWGVNVKITSDAEIILKWLDSLDLVNDYNLDYTAKKLLDIPYKRTTK